MTELANIASITVGHPFRGAIPEKVGSGVYAIQMKDTSPSQGINWQTIVETEAVSERSSDWLQRGDILLAARGNHNYAVMVDTQSKKALAAPHFFVIRLKTDKVLPEFLVWQLNQEPLQRYFNREAAGSVTKSIRRNVVDAVKIAAPSLAKQQQIIKLQSVLQREQQLIEQLTRNGEQLMSALANQLLKTSG